MRKIHWNKIFYRSIVCIVSIIFIPRTFKKYRRFFLWHLYPCAYHCSISFYDACDAETRECRTRGARRNWLRARTLLLGRVKRKRVRGDDTYVRVRKWKMRKRKREGRNRDRGAGNPNEYLISAYLTPVKFRATGWPAHSQEDRRKSSVSLVLPSSPRDIG